MKWEQKKGTLEGSTRRAHKKGARERRMRLEGCTRRADTIKSKLALYPGGSKYRIGLKF